MDQQGKRAEPALAFTVLEFCEAYRISPKTFYVLRRDGRGPRIFKVGRRTLISAHAADEWRRQSEAAAA